MDTPNQVIDQRQISTRVGLPSGVAQADFSQHLRPGATQKTGDQFGQAAVLEALHHGARKALRQQHALLGVLACVQRIFALAAPHRLERGPVLLQRLQHAGKCLRVARALYQGVDRIRDTGHKAENTLAVTVVMVAREDQAALRNPVQQLAGRMRAVDKKPRVGFGKPRQHRLKHAQLRPHRQHHPLVLRQLVQHHAHHFVAELAPDLLVLGLGTDQRDRRHGTYRAEARLHRRLGGTFGQTFHHRLDQPQVLQGHQRGRHGMREVPDAGATRRKQGFAGQQAAQFVQGGHGPFDLGLGQLGTCDGTAGRFAGGLVHRFHSL